MHRLLVILLAILLTSILATPVQAGEQVAEYNMPSSIAIQGVFGFGILFCATPGVPSSVTENAKNGPCFDFQGDGGDPFILHASDDVWGLSSVTIAIDLNGDGCISSNCNGVPNEGNDYRASECGTLIGTLPELGDHEPVVQIFLRVIDVSESLEICGATRGKVVYDTIL